MRIHRPCPFVSCRFHLHTDVQHGTVTILGGDIANTCTLDVVEEHPEGVTREEIASILRVSEERTRFHERRIEKKLRAMGALVDWEGHHVATDDREMQLDRM